jgi:hypothetical protein
MSLFFLLLGMLVLTLYGLQALRSDAIRLVLGPLQRMLKIVLRCKFCLLLFDWFACRPRPHFISLPQTPRTLSRKT